MAKSKRRRKKAQRFESVGVLVSGRARARRRPSALRWQTIRLRGLLFLLVGAVVACALWLALDSRFYIYEADVVGAVRLLPEEVFRASGLDGLHILWARPAEIEDLLLEALPTLESVQAKCHLPARCAIVVVERQPKVLWDDGGVLWWIDAEGVVFQPPLSSSAGEDKSVGWTVRGSLPRDEQERLEEGVRIGLKELWATGTDVASAFEYDPERGLMFVNELGWRVILGEGGGMAKRLQVLERVTAELVAQGSTPRFVDVRFPDAPYYSLTNDW
jgi:hypothetical protein